MMLEAGATLMITGALAMFAGFFLTAEYSSVPGKDRYGPMTIGAGWLAVISSVAALGVHAVMNQTW